MLILPNGDRYEGSFLGGERSGEGTCVYVNGDRYIGTWAKDSRHGPGEIAFARGGGYDGGWVEDKMEGEGELTLPDGRVASGVWKAGELSGVAKLQLPMGAYVGELQQLPDGSIVPSGKGKAVASHAPAGAAAAPPAESAQGEEGFAAAAGRASDRAKLGDPLAEGLRKNACEFGK